MTQQRPAEPQPFKASVGPQLVEELALRLLAIHTAFPATQFIAEVTPQLEPLELKGRIATIAAGLRRHLPPDYPAAMRLLLALLDAPPTDAEGMFSDGWLLWPIAAFVEHYGLEHLDESLQAMHAITQRHTAEFAIRPFLLRYPEQILATLQRWAHDPSFHVRRLVSEGTRPRLPWAARLPTFLADPAPVLALLEVLKDDPSDYVRKSVANNLNDIAKDHPELVLATLARWQQGAGDERQWIIRHALRTLVKQGHPEALRLLGAEAPEVELIALELTPATLRIGETLTIAVTLRSTAAASQQLVVDYVLHLPGARGAARAKVFKLRSQVLAAGATLRLLKQHSFAPVTVRRLYPGPHRIAVQVNGVILGEAAVQVHAAED
ncbi:MAG: DNA alkylation repair protein [Chloroflexales bacterium]|nr:DNA alkylation repair protein [Chloroflexales bacterium]